MNEFQLTAEVSDLTFTDPYHTEPSTQAIESAPVVAVLPVEDAFEFQAAAPAEPIEEAPAIVETYQAEETEIGAWVIFEGYSAFQLRVGLTYAEYVAAGEPFGEIDPSLF